MSLRNKVRLSQSPVKLASGAGLGKNNLRLRDEFKKKIDKISDIEQKGGRGVESISLFLIY